jgi:hypothetical protein
MLSTRPNVARPGEEARLGKVGLLGALHLDRQAGVAQLLHQVPLGPVVGVAADRPRLGGELRQGRHGPLGVERGRAGLDAPLGQRGGRDHRRHAQQHDEPGQRPARGIARLRCHDREP